MRIAIDLRLFAPRSSGQQRYLWRLGLWLGDAGHDVHLLTVRPQSTEAHADAVDAAGRTRSPVRLHQPSPDPDDVRRQLEALDPDVLLLNPERSPSYRAVRPNVLRTGYGTDQYVEKLRSFHRPGERPVRRALRETPWVRSRRDIERSYYGTEGDAPDVIAQSTYIAEAIHEAYPHAAERLRVLHNPVDLDEFSPDAREAAREAARARLGVPPGVPCVGLLGHNYRLKGLETVVRALADWPEPDTPHLLVAGKGTGRIQRGWAERLVARAGLSDRVRFAGDVHPSVDALAAMDALAHLSWHDSFGFAVLEAMATGLPVVTTPWVGASELIDHGSSGWVVDPADAPAVLERLRAALGEKGREVGASARAVALQHGEPDHFARVETLLRDAAERARPILR